jgi:hypothetical protein
VNGTKSPTHRVARRACLASLTAALLTTGCSSQPRATGTISGQLLGYGGPPALEPNGSIATRSPFPVEGTITVHGSGGYSVTTEASEGFSLVVPEGDLHSDSPTGSRLVAGPRRPSECGQVQPRARLPWSARYPESTRRSRAPRVSFPNAGPEECAVSWPLSIRNKRPECIGRPAPGDPDLEIAVAGRQDM